MSLEGQNVATTERPRPAAVPTAAAADTPPRSGSVYLPALLTGVLWWACHFPLNWSWLAWIALVPLLTLTRATARPRRIYCAAWLSGMVFYWAAIQWMRYADFRMYFTWAALATYCSLYVPLTIFLVRRLEARTRWPLTVTFPLVWTSLEYVRAHFGTGFPWYFLAHSQHDHLWLIQISDVTGAYGLSFLIAAVNALAFEALASLPNVHARFGLAPRAGHVRLQFVGVAVLFAATALYGCFRLQQSEFERGPKVAIVQPSILQRIRNEAAGANADPNLVIKPMMDQLTELHEAAVRTQPDLIVWPETSFPDEWWEPAPELRREDLPPLYQALVPAGDAAWTDGTWRERLAQKLNDNEGGALRFFRKWPVPVLFGMNSRVKKDMEKSTEGKHFNSAILLRDESATPWFTRYDKIHRVPFGEYIPFRDWIAAMNSLSPYENDYSVISGDTFTRFALGKYHFGALICFEDTDPYLARQYVRNNGPDEPAVDFLVNQSNDGWFDGSAEHDEHLAICRFRAVECRRSLARSVNMGISALIDGNGRIVALPAADWASSKKLSTNVVAEIPLDRRGSLYAAWGDWLPVGGWLVIGAGLFGRRLRKRSTATA